MEITFFNWNLFVLDEFLSFSCFGGICLVFMFWMNFVVAPEKLWENFWVFFRGSRSHLWKQILAKIYRKIWPNYSSGLILDNLRIYKFTNLHILYVQTYCQNPLDNVSFFCFANFGQPCLIDFATLWKLANCVLL